MVLPNILELAVGPIFNAIGAKPVLKIHPAIGVARLGDDPNAFFIGPETPGLGPTGQDEGAGSATPPFRSTGRSGGKIKRQAARFRIFNYLPGGFVEEINLDNPQVKEIEWTVHLANRKAAFFEFLGQLGASGPYSGAKPPLRNPGVVAAREAQLVIDPGARSIKADRGTFKVVKIDSSSGNFPKDSRGPVIGFLGELQLDNKGRLLVLGGRGQSASSDALTPNAQQVGEMAADGFRGPPTGPGRPPAALINYANNDTWFDDVSDGPVTAKITLKSGKTLKVDFPSWVLVAPPDFAPGVRNVISLYDTMLDVAVRKLPAPAAFSRTTVDLKSLRASVHGTKGFRPDFDADILPTLRAGADVRFVHDPEKPAFHGTLDIPALQSNAPGDQPMRKFIFDMLRPPAGNTNIEGPGSMPKLHGDEYDNPPSNKSVAAVTQTQFHILGLWRDGEFDVNAGPPVLISPEGLDRAALESCVGGAFFPGIECSWLCREKDLYMEPFRIKHGAKVGPLVVGPGFFSQQMALPWQADFLDCRRDPGRTPAARARARDFVFFGWWPAQRPDDVFKSAADASSLDRSKMVPWARGIIPGGPQRKEHLDMVQRWNQLGFVVAATVGTTKVHFEQERIMSP
jgi:hypothetical protein